MRIRRNRLLRSRASRLEISGGVLCRCSVAPRWPWNQTSPKLTLCEDGEWSVKLLYRADVRYEADGRNRAFTAYSNQNAPKDGNAAQIRPDELKTLGQVKDEQLGMSDKVDFFTTSATIAFIKSETFAYPACANPDGCNKKVVDDGSGWLCEKCNLKFPQPIWR